MQRRSWKNCRQNLRRQIGLRAQTNSSFQRPKAGNRRQANTGAETSSLDAKNIRPFERDGEKWVSFDIINRKNGEKHHYQKPVKRKTNIVRTGEEERRYVVHMDIKFGKEIINAEFTLNDRDKFDYQVLIGRNIINGRFIIDPSLENTMH